MRLTNRDIEIILSEVREYFDQRADAEYFTDRAAAVPNDEMALLVGVDDIIDELTKRGILSPRQGEN